jgi:hypothetical protein
MSFLDIFMGNVWFQPEQPQSVSEITNKLMNFALIQNSPIYWAIHRHQFGWHMPTIVFIVFYGKIEVATRATQQDTK